MPGLGVMSSTSENRVPGATLASLGYAVTSRCCVEACVACTGVAGRAGPQHDVRDGIALPVVVLEEARRDTPLPVDHERAGKRDASVPLGDLVGGDVHGEVGENRRILAVRAERLLDDGVEDAVAPDGGRADIRQERKGDVVPRGEASQDLLRVVADRDDADSVLAELFETALQLHELRAAERSPVRRAEEHQHRAAWTHDRFEGADAAGLIRKAEIRNALAYLRSELGDIDFHRARTRPPGPRPRGRALAVDKSSTASETRSGLNMIHLCAGEMIQQILAAVPLTRSRPCATPTERLILARRLTTS